MRRLKFLELVNVKLKGGYKSFAENLKWLSWHGFTEESLPKDLNLENLVGLDLRNSYKLKQLWRGIKVIVNLKILNLKNCKELIRTPDFSGLPSLEVMSFKNCTNLAEIHKSIGELKRLVYLNLKNCKSLRKFPESFSGLQSLEQLVLKGCEGLGHRSVGRREQEPFWVRIWNIGQGRSSLPSFSLSNLPQSLVELDLSHCNIRDDQIPNDIAGFCSLTTLRFIGNPITTLPESLIGLTKLKILDLCLCTNLQSLPPLPPNLNSVAVLHCWQLREISFGPSALSVLTGDITRVVKLERSCDLGLFKYCDFLNLDYYINLVERMSNNFSDDLPESSAANSIGEQYDFNAEEYLELHGGQELINIYNDVLRCYDGEGNDQTTEQMTGILANFHSLEWAQILHSEKISYIFLPGNHALECYPSVRSGDWNSFFNRAFVVPQPPHPESKFWGWSICVQFQQLRPFVTTSSFSSFHIGATNLTRELNWGFFPSAAAETPAFFIHGVYSEGEWVSVWRSETFFRPGDIIEVDVNMGECLEVKAIGVRFLHGDYNNEEEPPIGSSHTTTNEEEEDLTTRIAFFVPPDDGQPSTYRNIDLHNLPF